MAEPDDEGFVPLPFRLYSPEVDPAHTREVSEAFLDLVEALTGEPLPPYTLGDILIYCDHPQCGAKQLMHNDEYPDGWRHRDVYDYCPEHEGE